MDLSRARADASAILVKLIQVDTTNPPGSERSAALVVSGALEASGVRVELIPAGAGRSSVFARFPAARSSRPPLVLLSHLDVPGADPAAWPADAGPFAGVVKDGAIWGRGALGGKGLAAVHAAALAAIARAKLSFDRDVLLIAAADAERGGHRGIEQIMAARAELLSAGLVLGEGGYTVLDPFGEGLAVHAIATGEKGFAELEVVAASEDAPVRLARALDRLAEQPPEPVLTQPAVDFLGFAAAEMSFPSSWVLRSPLLARTFELDALASLPWVGAMFADEVRVTSVSAGDRAGASVDRARARLSASLLPGTGPGALREWAFRAIGDAKVHVTVSDGEESSASAFDAAVFGAIARGAQRGGREVAAPVLAASRTDLRFFRRHGILAYGFAPFAVTPAELESVRGRDERLAIAELERGVAVMVALIAELATPADSAASSARR